ncbi:ABC transporter permease [Kineothrix sp. MB12-C1]|uniref:ABC transporter permease n=1 Tax=Kineothrix sp. MB12-C1 TaxID=3070215 RepID=UPI0027D2614B|nr:ABC transporter permease [Kineothrix sp. MB12-C1]WMC92281.1 ABC transporter permease [Kineothrix sp. MB12-C1]
MRRKKKNYNLIAGSTLTGMMLFFIVIGFFYTPYDPNAMDATAKFAGISWKHWMGADNFGRDVFSRVLQGSATTFFVALWTVLIGTVCGVLLGTVTGYYGGILDDILMRINDAIFAFPSLLLALVFISILGPGKNNVIAALGIAFIPSFARIVRGEFLKHRNMDYVKSAKLQGAGDLRIMFVHILPNVMPVLLSAVMIGFNNAVLAEAGMSYLGIGVQPPEASLGRMLSEAQSYLFTAPAYAVFPGLVIILMVLGFSLLGEGIGEKE